MCVLCLAANKKKSQIYIIYKYVHAFFFIDRRAHFKHLYFYTDITAAVNTSWYVDF